MIFFRRKKKRKKHEERLKLGLSKTRKKLTSRIKDIFTLRKKIDEDFLDELEETLIASDVGVEMTMKIVEDLKKVHEQEKFESEEQIFSFLKSELKRNISEGSTEITYSQNGPTVILVAGVNGTGKTTSIGKLAYLFKEEGKRVLLAASDTFRAAACEQLEIWSKRVGVGIIRNQPGVDPASVVFDACEASFARDIDILIVDTAGRLHTKGNLMNELSKIKRVIRKKIPDGPHEVLLVLDATTGQNAIAQAELFNKAIDITGLFLAKLDGTAKGGIVISIKNKLDIPVKFIGVGEKQEDIERFEVKKFVDALLD